MSKQQGAGGKSQENRGWSMKSCGLGGIWTPAPLAQNHYVIKVAITAGKAKIEN